VVPDELYERAQLLCRTEAAERLHTTAAAAATDQSIAVLPFASLSEEKANASFATGIQDELLAHLSEDCRPESDRADVDTEIRRAAHGAVDPRNDRRTLLGGDIRPQAKPTSLSSKRKWRIASPHRSRQNSPGVSAEQRLMAIAGFDRFQQLRDRLPLITARRVVALELEGHPAK